MFPLCLCASVVKKPVVNSPKTREPEESHDRNPHNTRRHRRRRKLFNLSFTPPNASKWVKTLSDRLAQYDTLRATPLDNAVPLALHFNVNRRR